MNYDDAMASNDCEKWKEVVEAEINAIEENETWFSVSEN